MLTSKDVENHINKVLQLGFEKQQLNFKSEHKPHIYPSKLMTCYLSHYWFVTGVEATNIGTFLTSGSLTLGTLIHSYFENLTNLGDLGEGMVEKKLEYNAISGKADYIAKINGEYILIDHKTTSDASYYKKMKEEIPNTIKAQITFYILAVKELLGLDIKQGAIHYVNQNMYDMTNRFIKIFTIESEYKEMVNKYISELKNYINNKVEPDGKPFEFWECGYNRLKFKNGYKEFINICPYFNRCREKGTKGKAESTYWRCKKDIENSIKTYTGEVK